MKSIFKRFFLAPLIFLSSISAQDYFIRLTPSGQAQRSELLTQPSTQSLIKQSAAEFLPALEKTISANRFNEWLTLSTIDDMGPQVLEQLSADGIIDYYEPIGVFHLQEPAGEEDFGEQWHLSVIDIETAWQVSNGVADIIIGVIDTGIDYRHPDLRGGLWVNTAELYGLPNIDDDNNGFVDDSLGWDFTDAPRLADGGDYLDPDNDPMDEYGSGHGTQIAGIICGQKVDDDGVIGVAPGARVMNLRAGTASGYLEEDDVANAVLYAVDNHAAVINMSFGDVVISRLLKDVLFYAHQRGVVLIGSAGNSGSDHINYPAGLDYVISVGSTTKEDVPSGFSNYGNSIDLLAPGSEIYSTAVDNNYNKVSGTSFSAPMVSALAALLLSSNSEYDFNQIKNIMKSSALEFPEEDYNKYLGAGRIEAGKALQVPHGGILEITTPGQNGSTALDSLWIIGSAAHPDLDKIIISYGYGVHPQEWFLIAETKGRQVLNDAMGLLLLTDIPDTTLTLQANLFLRNGGNQTERIQFRIDRTPPKISAVQTISMLDGDSQSILISFVTDDITRARIYVKTEGKEGLRGVESGYETQNHRIKIDRRQFNGAHRFKIEAENESGLFSADDADGNWYEFEMDLSYEFYPFESKGWEIPPGYLLDKFTDVNQDGIKEAVISAYDNNNAFGPLEIYQYNNGQFKRIYRGVATAIPRDAGDVNQNGLPDILTGFGERATILEFDTLHGLKTAVIWQDDIWAAAYTDLDGDGQWEIIGRQENEYVILEYRGNNNFEKVASLPNPTEGENQYGAPHVVEIDMNGDGKNEVAFGDYDGDVIIYQNTGNNTYSLFSTMRTLQPDATEMLTVLNQTGQPDIFYAGSHTSEDYKYEHELDAKYRTVELLEYQAGAQKVTSVDTTHYFGYRNSKEYDSGLKIGRMEEDVYLFASFFPNLYAMRYEDGQLIPVWRHSQSRSNTLLIADFDDDGSNEILFNSGEKITAFSMNHNNRPPAPYPLTLEKVDSVSIRFSWNSDLGSSFKIYKGNRPDNLAFYKPCNENIFIDENVQLDSAYYYAVTLLDTSFDNPESAYSVILKATPGMPPKLIDAKPVNSRQLILTFSDSVNFRAAPAPSAYLKEARQFATSILRMGDHTKFIATFDRPFLANTIDSVRVEYIYNERWIELDSKFGTRAVIYNQPQTAPFLAGFERNSSRTVRLIFSESMNRADLLNLTNYRIEPRGSVEDIEILNAANNQALLSLSADTPPGSAGIPLYLYLENLHSVSGSLLEKTSKISLNTAIDNLNNIIIYPQPVKPGHDKVFIGNLPQVVKIVIYNLSGRVVRVLEGDTGFGAMEWDLKDENDQEVASGIYIYMVIHENNKNYGKLAIVR